MSSSPDPKGGGTKKKKKKEERKKLQEQNERLMAEVAQLREQRAATSSRPSDSRGQRSDKTLSTEWGIASSDSDRGGHHYGDRHNERRSRRDDKDERQNSRQSDSRNKSYHRNESRHGDRSPSRHQLDRHSRERSTSVFDRLEGDYEYRGRRHTLSRDTRRSKERLNYDSEFRDDDERYQQQVGKRYENIFMRRSKSRERSTSSIRSVRHLSNPKTSYRNTGRAGETPPTIMNSPRLSLQQHRDEDILEVDAGNAQQHEWKTIQRQKQKRLQPQPQPATSAPMIKKKGWWIKGNVKTNAYGETKPLNRLEANLQKNLTTYGEHKKKGKRSGSRQPQARLTQVKPSQTMAKPATVTQDQPQEDRNSTKRNLSGASGTTPANTKFVKAADGGRGTHPPPPPEAPVTATTSVTADAGYWDTAAVRISTIRIVAKGNADGGLSQQDIHYISSEFVTAKRKLLGQDIALHREVNNAKLGKIHGAIRIKLRDLKGLEWWKGFVNGLKPLEADGPGYKVLEPGESETSAYRVQIIDPALAGDKNIAAKRFVDEAFMSHECPLRNLEYRVQVHTVNPTNGIVTIYIHLVDGQHEEILKQMDYSLQYGIQSYSIVSMKQLFERKTPAAEPAVETAEPAKDSAVPTATDEAPKNDDLKEPEDPFKANEQEVDMKDADEVVDEDLLDKSSDSVHSTVDDMTMKQKPKYLTSTPGDKSNDENLIDTTTEQVAAMTTSRIPTNEDDDVDMIAKDNESNAAAGSAP